MAFQNTKSLYRQVLDGFITSEAEFEAIILSLKAKAKKQARVDTVMEIKRDILLGMDLCGECKTTVETYFRNRREFQKGGL